MIPVSQLRTGTVFEDGGQYFQVISYEHIKMGRGSGNIKLKVRNLSNGATVEKSFLTGGKIQEAQLTRKKVQFLYQDNSGFHLMDLDSFEQSTIAKNLLEDLAKFIKEGMELVLFTVNDQLLYAELPKIVEYRINQTGGTNRGNTVGASSKDAVLENGLVVKVPLFIKVGEFIKVNTESGEYVERVKLG